MPASCLIGQNAFGYRKFARPLQVTNMAAYAAIEMACIDACARATGRRFCELVGGPVRDSVEFAAYLFFRYAADHPVVLSDPRLVDSRGRGDRALDSWGEVRTPEAMAAMAAQFRDRVGLSGLQAQGGRARPGPRAPDDEGTGRTAWPEGLAADRPQRPVAARHGRADRQEARSDSARIL